MRWKLVEVIERGRRGDLELEDRADVEERARSRITELRRARTDGRPLRRTRVPGASDWRIERLV